MTFVKRMNKVGKIWFRKMNRYFLSPMTGFVTNKILVWSDLNTCINSDLHISHQCLTISWTSQICSDKWSRTFSVRWRRASSIRALLPCDHVPGHCCLLKVQRLRFHWIQFATLDVFPRESTQTGSSAWCQNTIHQCSLSSSCALWFIINLTHC